MLGKFFVCILVLLLIGQLGCKTEEVEESFELPITTSSKEAREFFIEGRNFEEFGHPDKAQERYDQAIAIDPDFAMAWLFKVGIAVETDDFQTYLKKALELAPTVSEGEQKMLAAYQAYFNDNDRVKTNQLYQELAAMYPKDVRMHWYAGNTYDGLNKKEEALASFQKGLALDPEFAPLHERIGYFYRWEKDFTKAEASFKEYMRLAPNEANSYDCLADLYRTMGRFDESLAQYQRAYEMDTSFQASAYKAATTHFFLGNFEEGRQGLKDLMELRTEPGLKYYDMQGIMRSYLYEGDMNTALEMMDRLIMTSEELGLPEESSWARIYKGILYYELKDYEAANASFDSALNYLETTDLVASFKNNQTAYAGWWKAWVAAASQDFDKANEFAQEFKAYADETGNPFHVMQFNYLQAFIALSQGDHAQALEFFDQTDMKWAYAMYYQALTKEKAGDMEGAKAIYEKIANFNFENQWVALVRKKAMDKLL